MSLAPPLVNVPEIVRTKCRQCQRSFHPQELMVGLCGNCWNARIERFPDLNTKEFASDELTRCFQCKHPFQLQEAGYLTWDESAKAWAVLCVPCAEHKWATDRQYRGTEFSHRAKLQ